MPKVKNAQLRYRIIDRCIRNKYKPFPTKGELREACEQELYGSEGGERISDSTIEKDLFTMRQELDAPIRYSKRDNGYYYEDPGFTLDEIPLEEEHVAAIRFAAQTLYQFKTIGIFRQFDDAITKILDSVQEGEIARGEEDKTIQFNNIPPAEGAELLSPVVKAINNKKQLQFKYKKFTQEDSDIRRVHPYMLREYRNRWYLIGYAVERGELRTFGLDRIHELEILDESFSSDPSFDPEQFFKYAVGITVLDGYPETVRLRFDKRVGPYLKSQPIHHSQVIEKEDENHVFVKIEVWVTPELITMLLGYGSEVKVLEPEHLQEKIRDNARQILEDYS